MHMGTLCLFIYFEFPNHFHIYSRVRTVFAHLVLIGAKQRAQATPAEYVLEVRRAAGAPEADSAVYRLGKVYRRKHVATQWNICTKAIR